MKSNEKLENLREEFVKSVKLLQFKQPTLQVLQESAQTLHNDICNSWKVAEDVITQIQHLDLARRRVQACLRHVEKLINLKSCKSGFQIALQKQDYEKAASFINNYLSCFDPQNTNDINDSNMANLCNQFKNIESDNKNILYHSSIPQTQEMEECKKLFTDKLNTLLEKALVDENEIEIDRFLKLYPLIGANSDGIGRFNRYSVSKLHKANKDAYCNIEKMLAYYSDAQADKAKTVTIKFPVSSNMQQSSTAKSYINIPIPTVYPFSDILLQIYGNCVHAIDKDKSLLQQKFGPSHFAAHIKFLQREEIDKITGLVFENGLRNAVYLPYIVDFIEYFYYLSYVDGKRMPKGQKGSLAVDYIDKRYPKNVSQNPAHITLTYLDTLINELVQCISQTQYYIKFLETNLFPTQPVYNGELKNGQNEEDILTKNIPAQNNNPISPNYYEYMKPITESELYTYHQSLLSQYLVLERAYLYGAFSKAEQLHCENQDLHNSPLIDETFYIMLKCIRRSFNTLHLDGICAMLNYVGDFFENTLIPNHLSLLPLGNQNGSFSSFMQHIQPTMNLGLIDGSDAFVIDSFSHEHDKTDEPDNQYDLKQEEKKYMKRLNDIELSVQYLDKFIQQIESEARLALDFQNPFFVAHEKFNNCLSIFVDARNHRLPDSLTKGINELNDCVLKTYTIGDISHADLNLHHTRGIKIMETANYVLHEDQLEDQLAMFNDTDAKQNWCKTLIESLNNIALRQIKPCLSESLYFQLIDQFTSQLPDVIENAMLKIKYNKFGAIKMDRELRKLIAFLNTLDFATVGNVHENRVSKTLNIRNKFCRILQISSILNVETREEFEQYIQDHVIPCSELKTTDKKRLTEHEIRQCISLRLDYK